MILPILMWAFLSVAFTMLMVYLTGSVTTGSVAVVVLSLMMYGVVVLATEVPL